MVSVSINAALANPPGKWQRVLPDEAGFAPEVGEMLDEAAGTAEFANLHAVVVARNGKLVMERYYAGADERRGQPLGNIQFGPEVSHDMRSVTKSIVGLLYGIALSDGKVAEPDRPLIDKFPEYADLAADPDKKRLKVAHALSMTLGLEWNEDLPYTDPRNSETAMDAAEDRYRYVLERPLATAPGSQWAYNGGATALLAHMISRGTGQPLLEFARARLFEPLGMRDVEWLTDEQGVPIAASGLRLRPRDLAKIGQLILNRGTWGETRILPAAWLDQSFAPRAKVDDEIDYGYHWWLGKLRSGQPWMAAFGNGGQRLYVAPSLQLVVVITAGNYNKPDQWKLPVAVMSKVIFPAFRGP